MTDSDRGLNTLLESGFFVKHAAVFPKPRDQCFRGGHCGCMSERFRNADSTETTVHVSISPFAETLTFPINHHVLLLF